VETLGPLDAAFLSLETVSSHLHVAAVLVLDPPEGRRSLFSPSTRFAQLHHLVAQRIHLVPRFRQRAVPVPLGLHHPVWVDDPEFELEDHLTRASVPAPGGSRELDVLVADVMSRPLDPDRPLWEMVVVEGLAAGRWALLAKVHHAILDGVSGAAVLAQFLDLGPRARVVAPPAEPWDPAPLPSRGELMRHAVSSLAQQPGVVVGAAQRSVAAMADVGTHNRQLSARGEVPPPALFSAPRTPLNGPVSSRRRYASVSLPLADLKLVRHAFGATVNDVILSGVAGALRRHLERGGALPHSPLVALVPVSTRSEAPGTEPGGAAGNRVSGMLVSLGTDIDDPVDRLATIAAGTRAAKAQERLTRGRLLEDMAQMATPAVVSRAVRWAAGLRLFERLPPPYNVTVSSVPGPSFPLWCAGSRVVAFHPVGPIGEGTGLNVTAMTYLGEVYFGLLGCRRLVPGVQDLAIMLDDALAELVVAALGTRRAVG
jgi:WS/DGAT/MGAT family acyltransferase